MYFRIWRSLIMFVQYLEINGRQSDWSDILQKI